MARDKKPKKSEKKAPKKDVYRGSGPDREPPIGEDPRNKPRPKPEQEGGGGGGGGGGGASSRKKSKRELAAERMASRRGGPGSPGYERRLRAWMKEYGISEGGGRGGGRGGGGGAGGGAAVPASGWETFPFPTTPTTPAPPERPGGHPPGPPPAPPVPPGIPPREYPVPPEYENRGQQPWPERIPMPHPQERRRMPGPKPPPESPPLPGELPEPGAPPSPPSTPENGPNPYGAAYPAWWRGVKPKNLDENTQYQAIANMMIPFLSPEDQRTMATNLYAINPKDFGHLDPTKIAWGGAPMNEYGELSGQARSDFMSKGRAQAAMQALEALRGAMGKKEEELGPGYAFIKSLLGTLNSFGASQAATGGGGMTGMTRAQSRALLGALDPLMTMAKSDELGAYGPLAQALATPFFSSGELMPFSRTESGGYTFGKQNKRLFF